MTMNVQRTPEIERQIIQRIVKDALEAGFQITVDDGGDRTERQAFHRPSRHHGGGDADRRGFPLLQQARLNRSRVGSRLIYGNDGWDVVNDYTTNLEPLLAGATAEADNLGGATHG